MLKEYYINEVFRKIDLNCAESVLYTANSVYKMNLSNDSILLSSPFGGGMFIEEKCGAVTGALMVLGYIFVDENAHATKHLKEIIHTYFEMFSSRMGSCECAPLKEMHRTKDLGCYNVIIAALDILEEVIDRFYDKKAR